MNRDTPYLARIDLYPIKALDGIPVDRATLLSGGALKFDRQFAILDQQGQYVNGKRNIKVHQIRSQFNRIENTVSVRFQNDHPDITFSLEHDLDKLESWLSNYLGFPVTLTENTHTGFPDDLKSPGPTIISTATLEAVQTWFPELSLEEIRRRLRTNLEIAGVPAFWEDRLFGAENTEVKFRIGDVEFSGINPCQRCVVFTRNPSTGMAHPGFQKQFIEQRQTHLPSWVNGSRFNHFYRIAVNTRVLASEEGKEVRVGDEIELEWCRSNLSFAEESEFP